MKEVKSPKRPLLYYYGIALLVILLFNLIMTPLMVRNQVTEGDYGTFMRMTEDGEIDKAQVDSSQIGFTGIADDTIYTTGTMDDPTLTQRLYDAGAVFTKEVQKTASPLLTFFLTAILPLLIFVGIGQYMSKKLMEQAGGKNSMMFGTTGKSNAKVYIPSSQSIHFSDVTGEGEAKESLQEIVDYLYDPQKYTEAGLPCQQACCWLALRAPARPCWPKPWPVKPTCRFSPSPARSSWRCSWVWAQARCATCSARQRKRPLHRLHRRDRRHRPEAQQRQYGRQ